MADKEDGPVVSDTQYLSEVIARETEVNKLLLKKDKINALVTSLYNPPIGTKSIEIKDRNANIVEKVLVSVADAEISGLIDSLDNESLDTLMKYIYRFMSKSSNCSLMLKLHAVLVDKAGVGSIVRVLTDRKQV